MGIFKKEKRKNVLIVGCGRLGSSLASLLSEQEMNVVIVDQDENSFRKLSASFGGQTLEGDGSDIDHLVFAGAQKSDILIASTDDDDINIMIAQIARVVFKIEIVLTRIYDTSKQIAFENMGIIAICPTDLSIREFEKFVLAKERGAV